jgi:hypothetical protein
VLIGAAFNSALDDVFPRLSGIDHEATETEEGTPADEAGHVGCWPECEIVAQNPNNRTAFSYFEKRFDSIMASSGVLVRAHRSGTSARVAAAGAPGVLARPSGVGFDRATLRRPEPDEVDDVSLLRCLIPLPAASAWR